MKKDMEVEQIVSDKNKELQYFYLVNHNRDYLDIKTSLAFLNQHLEDIKYNEKQLDVLKTSMTSVFKYQDSIDRENGRRSIPRTWSDLNKYTLFY